MSIEFNWEKLLENSSEIEQGICDFLHNQFQSLNLPPFISSLAVSSFKLGSVPPEVVLKHFSDPFADFYDVDKDLDDTSSEASSSNGSFSDVEEASDAIGNTMEHKYKKNNGSDFSDVNVELDVASETGEADEAEEANASFQFRRTISENNDVGYTQFKDMETDVQENPMASPFDIQSFIEFKYSGDMQLSVMATLLVNYPAPSFISLPFSIRVTNVEIDSLIVAAVIKNRVHISIMCDLEDDEVVQTEPASVIKSMKIESEIGDNSNNGAVLRNVSKVEKFVLEQLRNVIKEELVWPGWITLEL